MALMGNQERKYMEKQVGDKLKSLARKGTVDQLVIRVRSLCERYPKAAVLSHSYLRVHEKNIHEMLSQKLDIKRLQVKYLQSLKDVNHDNHAPDIKNDQLQEIAMDVKTAILKGHEADENFFRLLNGRGENPLADKEKPASALLQTIDLEQLAAIIQSTLVHHKAFCQSSDNLRIHYFITLHDVFESKIKNNQPLDLLLRVLTDFSRANERGSGEIWLRTFSHCILQMGVEFRELKVSQSSSLTPSTFESQSFTLDCLNFSTENESTFNSFDAMELDDCHDDPSVKSRSKLNREFAQTFERLQRWRCPNRKPLRVNSLKGKHASYLERIRCAKAKEISRRREQAELKRKSKIYLSRSYFQGDVPFIEIKQSDLIQLLQQATYQDSQLCQIVILEFVDVVLKKNNEYQTNFIKLLQQPLVNALNLDSFQSPMVVSTLVSIARKMNLDVDSRLLVAVCRNHSQCIYDGILKLEDSESISEEERPAKAEKRKLSTPQSTWQSLSMLYSLLEESDMEIGVYEKYLTAFGRESKALIALNLKIDRRYEEAISHYETLLAGDSIAREMADICERGFQESLLKSLQFSTLEKRIKDQHTSEDTNSESISGFEVELLKLENWKVLQSFLQCQVGNIFRDFDTFGDSQDSTNCLSKAFFKSERTQKEYCFEHSLASLLKNSQQVECEEIVRSGITHLCNSWEESIGLGEDMKIKRIIELQRLVELDEYLHSIGNVQEFERLLARWSKRQPKSTWRSMELGWDQILLGRYIFLRHAESSSLTSECIQTQRLCDEMKSQIAMKFATGFARCKNYAASGVAEQLGKVSTSCEYRSRKVKLDCIVKSNQSIAEKEHLSALVHHVSLNDSAGERDGVPWRIKCLLRMAHVYETMGENENALKTFREAIDGSKDLAKNAGIKLKYMAKTNFLAALFCDNQMKESNQNKHSQTGKHAYDETFLNFFFDSLLSAVEYGCEKANYNLPRFLEVIENIDQKTRASVKQLFKSRGFSVQPLIQWLQQLVYLHHKFHRNKDDELTSYFIQELSKHYPQAVYLAFQTVFGTETDSFLDHLFSHIKQKVESIEEVRDAMHLLQDPRLQINEVLKRLKPGGNKLNPEDSQIISYLNKSFVDQPKMSEIRGKMMREDENIAKMIHALSQKSGARTLGNEVKFLKPLALKSSTLRLFSTHLSRFEGTFEEEKSLVIPYQALGSRRVPSESHFPRLMSFDDRINFFPSKQRPVGVTMRGSDGKEYGWIVKCGEDLRLDERLQQVFGVMNRLMLSDVNCSKKSLHLLTYSIVTLSKHAGIIEFVGQSKPLESFVDKTVLNEQGKKFMEKISQKTWLHTISRDRHLKNSLVLKDGRILGIDFGYALGFATIRLPIPELVPFRMTPQFLGILHPVDGKGSMKHTMARVLQTLRGSRTALLNLLSLFAKDPVLSLMIDVDDIVKDVKGKLEGRNPFSILREQVTRNGRVTSAHQNLARLIDKVEEEAGTGSHSASLSSFEQADSLLEIATSRDILARAFEGWSPYV
ncbi:hypothetical protein GUITHDRAFT_104130 [Guillardia theta CCMP2712]|uniref:Uncharacterized protein n=2 Tax=Guillardia theta TaxID=55529 RepID=L1JP21_GUITC|nr:hypothetical protein GUITHDRAFT_104130 [Guillardia theta CCMP2712]EKX50321.1 hypothetical protein GUITHDRAFT_104130 [Guillardia theta CCMP2712]|eukprot:XP_005837301.1 hypothetical protein GUITHDRAFT_104130 [Guillardia theta CCMP2712]